MSPYTPIIAFFATLLLLIIVVAVRHRQLQKQYVSHTRIRHDIIAHTQKTVLHYGKHFGSISVLQSNRLWKRTRPLIKKYVQRGIAFLKRKLVAFEKRFLDTTDQESSGPHKRGIITRITQHKEATKHNNTDRHTDQ